MISGEPSLNQNSIVDESIIQRVMAYSISFNANGGTGAPSSISKIDRYPAYIPSAVPTRTGYIFCGWAETKNATKPTYYPRDLITKNKSSILYAVWKYFPYKNGNIYNKSFSFPTMGGTSGNTDWTCLECDALHDMLIIR